MMSDAGFIAVILAAGEGRRAGGYKPLWPMGNQLVIDHVIEAASSTCSEIRVVGGACFNELESHLKTRRPEVKRVRNQNWKEGGMFSSVQAGLAGCEVPVFIHPADIPLAGASTYCALASAFAGHSADFYRPIYNERGGHPVLLAPVAVRRAIDADPAANLREVLRACIRLDVPMENELILRDIDFVEDYEELKGLLDIANS
ncbi:MAG: NTP transferase domain-containing protein [Deltaproteobacteria bacterium]|nr:NTP transferase domain-containing protein [Deltaproteobacteria bacterium]